MRCLIQVNIKQIYCETNKKNVEFDFLELIQEDKHRTSILIFPLGCIMIDPSSLQPRYCLGTLEIVTFWYVLDEMQWFPWIMFSSLLIHKTSAACFNALGGVFQAWQHQSTWCQQSSFCPFSTSRGDSKSLSIGCHRYRCVSTCKKT